MKIGFVGFSASKFDEAKAQKTIDLIFRSIIPHFDDRIEIVSGTTYMGIPGMIYEEASKYGYKTIGVMCKEGYECDLYPCDEIYAIGDNWGDESKTFIKMIDILFRIGGGPQTLKEVEMAKARGIPVYEYELLEIK